MKGQFAQRRPQGAKAQVLSERTFRAPEKIFRGFFYFLSSFRLEFSKSSVICHFNEVKNKSGFVFLGLIGFKRIEFFIS
jgi:hypothetical protein